MKDKPLYLWIARALIAAVVLWNLQCAFVFFTHPEAYAPGFELSGIPGAAAVRGMAVLFVMWNIPYLVALWHPRKRRLSLWEALVMQAAGLIGESALLYLIPAGHATLRDAILWFIYFDTAGLVLLAGALFCTRAKNIVPAGTG